MIYLQDPDVTILLGDAAEQLRSLPDESVHMAVTSPPFYGLRDYGVDGQIGLEETPDEWAARLVEVFREVRRVLRRDGTLWLEVGDSYASNGSGGDTRTGFNARYFGTEIANGKQAQHQQARPPAPRAHGLKPKDLIGAPWLLAMALRADGWYLRSDIIWARPNPMPESVTDRPTKAHSYLFLLAKQARYFYDADAIREPQTDESIARASRSSRYDDPAVRASVPYAAARPRISKDNEGNPTGRNKRSVWSIATQPLPFDHYAAYPEKLVEPCILAGTSEHGVCGDCGAPWAREVERGESDYQRLKREQGHDWKAMDAASLDRGTTVREGEGGQTRNANGTVPSLRAAARETTGWRPTCGCDTTVVPATVLDPFLGSGTTALVARRLVRRSIGVELNPKYAALAAERLSQQSLFA